MPTSTDNTTANISFVTDRLAVGGDLAADDVTAVSQLQHLVRRGVSHIIDARSEWSDEAFVAAHAPQVAYLHHGLEDAGQRVPASWFHTGVDFALHALADPDAVVLTHCHMGINRGPSLGFAVLLALGWDAVDALAAIRSVRPIAYIDYAEDAVRWHHEVSGSAPQGLRRDLRRVATWRAQNRLDVAAVIRGIRQTEAR